MGGKAARRNLRGGQERASRRFQRPLLANCVEEPFDRRERIAVATTIRAADFSPPPHVATRGVGGGMSLASFLRFWAVAANRNSSLAPLGPRRRNRSSLRMRFRWGKSISTFFGSRREPARAWVF